MPRRSRGFRGRWWRIGIERVIFPIKNPDDLDPTVIAALWHDRLANTPTPADVEAFECWRRASPENAREYARVQAGLSRARDLKDAPEMHALRQEALAYLSTKPSTRTRWATVAVCALLLTVAGGSAWQRGAFDGLHAGSSSIAAQTYSTGPGERLDVTLADGSRVSLDARSSIRVVYTGTERRVTLAAGQALFRVAKALHRPFIVSVRDQEITAHGTEFDVRLDDRAIHVALLEGAVVVRNSLADATGGVRMKPNDLLVISGNSTTMKNVSDRERLISWKDGLIQFEDTPLKEAVLEMNRYLDEPIILGDKRIGEIRVSGSFPTGGSAAFLEAVQHSFPARTSRDASGRITLTSAE